MKKRNIIALVLVITMVVFVASPPPASALVGLTAALVIAFAGTIAVTQTVKNEKAKTAAKAEAQKAAEQASLENSEVAAVSP